MNELLQSLDKVASKLPMDGNKTLIFLGIKTLLPILSGFFPMLEPVALSEVIDNLLNIGIGLGLAHKAAKKVVRK